MAVTCGFTGLRHHPGHEPAGQRGCECVRGGTWTVRLYHSGRHRSLARRL